MPLYKITEKRLANRAREDSEGITALKAEIGLGTGSSSGGDSGSESEGSGKSDGESELQMDDEGGKYAEHSDRDDRAPQIRRPMTTRRRRRMRKTGSPRAGKVAYVLHLQLSPLTFHQSSRREAKTS